MNGIPLRLLDADDGFTIAVEKVGTYVVVDLPKRTQIVGSDAEAIAEAFEQAARDLRGLA